MNEPKKKICIVSSCGGHLTEIRQLLPLFSHYEHFYVLNDQALLAKDMIGKTYFITHSERDYKFFINLFEAYRLIKKTRPKIIISTGAGLIVPFSLVAKFFFNIKTMYIETMGCVDKPSLTGRIMYYLADYFYYQQTTQKQYFPKGVCIGLLLGINTVADL